MDIPQKKLDTGKYFKVFFTGILLLLLSFAPNIGVSVENNTTTKSFSFRNKPFNEVVDILCNQYNVEIFYDKALAKHSISGEYFNVSLENMLERMLKGNNISILTHSENNTIDIRFFGERNIGLVASSGFQSKSTFTLPVDPFTQKNIAKLTTISEQQENSKTARLKNYNYVDPFSGIRLGDFNTILQLQEKNKRQRLEDPRFIDPMTGKTYLELDSIKKEQEAAKEKRFSKDNSLEPFTGKNISDLNVIHQKQEKNKANRLNNPNAIDPLTGLTMSTLNNILKIQAENKKARFGF